MLYKIFRIVKESNKIEQDQKAPIWALEKLLPNPFVFQPLLPNLYFWMWGWALDREIVKLFGKLFRDLNIKIAVVDNKFCFTWSESNLCLKILLLLN